MHAIARPAVFAIVLASSVTPCFAQALNLNPYGLALDPYHVFPPGPRVEVSATARHRLQHDHAHRHRAHRRRL